MKLKIIIWKIISLLLVINSKWYWFYGSKLLIGSFTSILLITLLILSLIDFLKSFIGSDILLFLFFHPGVKNLRDVIPVGGGHFGPFIGFVPLLKLFYHLFADILTDAALSLVPHVKSPQSFPRHFPLLEESEMPPALGMMPEETLLR